MPIRPVCITLLAAKSRNNVIGRNNQLPWHLPQDLKRFRQLTQGHSVIMGRLTFESLGGKPLPGRTNIVLSRAAPVLLSGVEGEASLEAALRRCAGEREVFIIGGEKVYREALPYANRIELTELHLDIEGDAVFPGIDRREWIETIRIPQVAESGVRFDFVTYERRTPAKAVPPEPRA